MTDEQNLRFMNHPERIAAKSRLDDALEHIRALKCENAQAILVCMPTALKELEEAYENLSVVEAYLEQQVCGVAVNGSTDVCLIALAQRD